MGLGHIVATTLLVLVNLVARTIVGVVLGMLLTVDKSYSIDVVVILVIVVLVSSHYEFFLGPLKPNRSHWLRPITGYINIRHILIALLVLSESHIIIGHHMGQYLLLLHFSWIV